MHLVGAPSQLVEETIMEESYENLAVGDVCMRWHYFRKKTLDARLLSSWNAAQPHRSLQAVRPFLLCRMGILDIIKYKISSSLLALPAV